MKQTILRILWVLLGASLALFLALYVVRPQDSGLLLASLGGSTLFLFGLTSLPPTQPRALFGGHILSAFIGVICYQLFGDATWVLVFSVLFTIAVLLLTKTVHPPAGANPLIMIHAHAGFMDIWTHVLTGVIVLAATTFVWSRLGPGKVTYPVKWNQESPPGPNWGPWA
jgi:CBS-domain-containing membrane protein